MSEVLQATDVLDNSTQLSNLDYGEALDASIAGAIDVVSFPSQLDGSLLQRALNAPEVRLMSIAQAEAISKIIPGLKHVVLWRGLISLSRDIPNSDVDTCLPSAAGCWCERISIPLCNFCCWNASRAPGSF